jgi:hypothetical protein
MATDYLAIRMYRQGCKNEYLFGNTKSGALSHSVLLTVGCGAEKKPIMRCAENSSLPILFVV